MGKDFSEFSKMLQKQGFVERMQAKIEDKLNDGLAEGETKRAFSPEELVAFTISTSFGLSLELLAEYHDWSTSQNDQ